MYSRRKSVKLALACFGVIYLTLIIACAPLADAKILRNGEALSEDETKNVLSAAVLPVLNELNRATVVVQRNRGIVGDMQATVLLPMIHYYQIPTSRRGDPVAARFRRDDKTAVIKNAGSSTDYMSSYYAQRKAIMDKYKSQQKEIRERLKKAKSLIAATKKRKESGKIDLDVNNSTRDQTTDALPPNITVLTTESTVSIPTTTDYNPTTVLTRSSTIFNDTQITVPNSSQSYYNSSEDESVDYDSGELDLVTTTALPLLYETLRPPVASDVIDETEAPNVEPPREKIWQIEMENLSPQNEVDFNVSDHNLIRQERDNSTLIIDLGGQLTNPSVKNDSVRAFEQLEEMFFWDDPMDDERTRYSNRTESQAQDQMIEDDYATENGSHSDNASQSSDSLRFTVEIKSSPEVHITKNVKTLQTSTTTYRNSTHEVIHVNGVTNSTKRTNGVTAESLLPSLKNINFTYPTVLEPSAVGVGGVSNTQGLDIGLIDHKNHQYSNLYSTGRDGVGVVRGMSARLQVGRL